MKLVLPFPPSVNTYWRAPNKGPLKGRHLISEKGQGISERGMCSDY
jgi:crossover junction endodeoxyribonuclease RusA